jgi:pimeloyl-ACP methyl ester carboxylesterase
VPLIDVGGFRLHLQASGAGQPTVVLDAALAGSTISWTYVQPAVAALTRACAYDRAGLGRSDAGPLPRTAGRMADELRTLLDRAGERPPYLLVGHSFGGLVARIVAARFPESVAGLLLVDPAHPEDWVTPAPKEQARIDRGVALCRQGALACRLGVAHVVSALVGAGSVGLARAVVDLFTRGGVRADADWLLAPLWKLPPQSRRGLRSVWTRASFFEALGSQIASTAVSASEVLEASRDGYGDLPLTTISLTDPDPHRVRRQEALAALSTRGRHVIASSSGHWIPLDQPDVVVSEVRRLLSEIASGGEDARGARGVRAGTMLSTAVDPPRAATSPLEPGIDDGEDE